MPLVSDSQGRLQVKQPFDICACHSRGGCLFAVTNQPEPQPDPIEDVSPLSGLNQDLLAEDPIEDFDSPSELQDQDPIETFPDPVPGPPVQPPPGDPLGHLDPLLAPPGYSCAIFAQPPSIPDGVVQRIYVVWRMPEGPEHYFLQGLHWGNHNAAHQGILGITGADRFHTLRWQRCNSWEHALQRYRTEAPAHHSRRVPLFHVWTWRPAQPPVA